MFSTTMDLMLSREDRQILTDMLRATTIGAGLARRARVILALADGSSYAQIAAAHSVSDAYIARWKQRVVAGGVAALGDLPRSGRGDRLDPRVEAKILAKTLEPPPAPLTHWTTRRMAALIGVSHNTGSLVWRRAGLKPHRLERYVTSDDPDFESKAADIIGLYLTRRPTPWCFPLMRSRISKRSTAWTRCCRSRRAAPSGTDSSTNATGRSRCMRRLRSGRARCRE